MSKIRGIETAESGAGSLLGEAAALQHQYERQSSIEQRKQKGQFFTPVEVCQFMAGLLSPAGSEPLRLLDPGAGTGLLTAAVCDRLLALRFPRDLEFHLFENDPSVLPFLHKTMKSCCEALGAAGHSARYVVHEKDFILDAASTVFGARSLFDPSDYGQFDAVIMNPPYFKVNKDSMHARVMRDVVHGQPKHLRLFHGGGRRDTPPERAACCHYAPKLLQWPLFPGVSTLVSRTGESGTHSPLRVSNGHVP